MPRKPVTTREAMVDAAFDLVRREGHNALTVRALAAELGCSTQPIMYQFPALAELRELVYQRADAFHSEYILAGGDILGIGLRYVQFAAKEPALFRFLFQSGHFDGANLQDLIGSPEIKPLLAALGAVSSGDPAAVAERFEVLYVAVHGYASLIANNAMEFDAQAVEKTLNTLGAALLKDGDQS
ncbi:MAG: WHG domain-containing protein [Atopobiaceae bacterium]|nr:WHG domain-containing protein [Atopobiaceae bacterium]